MSGLYQTLSADMNAVQPNFTKSATEKLYERIKLITSEMEKEALFMLICEHARLTGDFVYVSGGPNELPYFIQVDDNSDLVLDLHNIPDRLKYIILKYTHLLDSQKEEVPESEHSSSDNRDLW